MLSERTGADERVNLNLRSKKGSVTDFAFIIIAVALLGGVLLLMGWKVIGTMTPIVKGVTPTTGHDAIDTVEGYNSLLDKLFVFMIIIISLASVVLAWFIRTHPIFFFITIMFDMVIVIGAYISSQIYENIANLNALSGMSDLFPATTSLMSNFALVILGLLAIQGIVMWSAIRDDL